MNVKKFKTTGMDYHVQFTNAFANVELSEYHNRLHEIFQSLLDEVTHGIPPHDQVRFVLHSSQLENPISFPFMPHQRLTTERVLAEFECMIQSNRHFHLNDSVDDHRCYMQPVEKRDGDLSDSEQTISEDDVTEGGYDQMLFFDFECRQENGNHEPNLCVIQNEAGDEWVFEGDNTWNEFCEWLFQKEWANCVVMAHNFQGYDSYFILQYLRENGVKYDVVIMRGAKVLSLSVDMFKIKFTDSLNFIPMRLADFPKTFAIDELAKGYFGTDTTHFLLQPERNESCSQGKVFRMA